MQLNSLHRFFSITNCNSLFLHLCNSKLEARIDNERQFKTAKRLQVPGDATVRKRFFLR